jgi:hypothetical protein
VWKKKQNPPGEREKAIKKNIERRTKVCLLSVQRKRTSSFLSLCLSFIRSPSLFYAVVFPLHRLFFSLSLFSSLVVVFFFFSLSLTLRLRLIFTLYSSIWKRLCISRVSDGCQRSAAITTTAFSHPVDVSSCSSQSLQWRVRTPIVFWVSRCARDAFRHLYGFRRFSLYCPLLVTVIVVKLHYYSNWLNNNNK